MNVRYEWKSYKECITLGTMKNQALIDAQMVEDAIERLRPLAKDLAADLVPWKTMINKHRVTEQEFSDLLDNDIFLELLDEERATWDSPEHTAERIRLKSQFAVEQQMLDVTNIVSDTDINPAIRLKAYAELIRLAGTDHVAAQRNAQGRSGEQERFSISIHLGEGRDPVCVSGSSSHEETPILDAEVE